VSGWLYLLCIILTVWNPASLALRLASTVANLSSVTTVTLLFLAARLVITGVGVAAGISLFMRRPWALRLTKVALMLFSIEAVARLPTRVGLSEAPPGTRLPLTIALIVHNAAWFMYVQKSRRVRTLVDLESQRKP
jgi:hypothetical protein